MDGESSLETVWAGWKEGETLDLDTLTLRQTEVRSAGEAQPRDEDLGPGMSVKKKKKKIWDLLVCTCQLKKRQKAEKT